MVGMASARVTNPTNDSDPHEQLAPGVTGRSDSRTYHPDMKAPHYTPPPPQPARSYTPVSKMAVHMGAAQPLYSNTAVKQHQMQHPQQPLYSNQQQALYSNVNAVPGQHHQHHQQHYASVGHRNNGKYLMCNRME